MSRTVDEKVVEMRLDNGNFEKNAATSISTLAKLKQSLNLTGASKGLENVSTAAKKVNLTPLSTAAETIGLKFNAMYTIADQAFRNMTNSAMAAGKRMISALTIDPVKTGFSEYETKINSIQTIMSNTASKGTTMEDVTRVIDELNTYADKTIYNFAEMTRNIGTFTAAGVGLEESAAAIQGIANLAAASGSTSQQASTAMYQLSQALAAGTVKLMDWNSVVNAGMGGEKFQNALKQTAREMGVAIDDIIKKNGSFRDSLHEEWLTADILNATLKKFTKEGAADYSQAMIKAGKYTKEQAEALQLEAEAMEDAATKVKTWSQLIDTTKESLQSGWGKTWEILVGDFEEAKEIFTDISEVVSGFIDKLSDRRNNLLAGALSSPWEKLSSKIEKAGLSTDDYLKKVEETLKGSGKSVDDLVKEYGSLSKAIKAGKVPADILTTALSKLLGKEDELSKSTGKVTTSLEECGKIADKVINGEFGDGAERIKKLTEAGYDYATVQNIVNERLGSSVRHISELTEEQKKNADQLVNLSDEQLKNKGYTEEQIEALRELKKAAEEGGTSMNELIESMEKPTGRDLIIDSFKNIAEKIGEIFKIVGEAWNNVFPDMEIDSSDVYSLIEKFYDLTEAMTISEKSADNFRRILEGIFSALDLSWSLASASFMGTLKIINEILKIFGTDVVEVLALIADKISEFNDWVELETIFGSETKWADIANIIVAIYKGIKKCVYTFMGLDKVKKVVEDIRKLLKDLFGGVDGVFDSFSLEGITSAITKFFDTIATYIEGGNNAENLGLYLIQGLAKGLWNGIKSVTSIMLDVAMAIFEAFCEFFGIHSPSKLMIAVGGFIIAGLVLGLTGNFPVLWDTVKSLGNGVIDIIKELDIGKILAALMAAGVIVTAKRILDIIEMFGKASEGLGNMFSGIGKFFGNIAGVFKSIDKLVNTKVWEARSNTILNFAKAIALLAASVALLTFVDQDNLWSAVGAIAVLAGIVAGLAILSNVMKDVDFSLGKMSVGMMGISVAILILAAAIKVISTIDSENVDTTLKIFAGMVIGLGVLALELGVLSTFSKSMDKAGTMLFKMAAALLIMTFVVKQIAKIDDTDLVRGGVVIAGIGLMFAGIIAVSFLAGENADKAGKLLIKMSIAMLIMVGVVKLASMLNPSEITRGLAFVAGVELLFLAMVGISIIAKDASKIGGSILAISVAVLIMVGVVKLASSMSDGEIAKGLAVIAAIEALFAGIIWVSKYAGQNAAKAGVMLLLMSGAVAIMAIIVYVLGEIDINKAAKSLGIIAIIETMFAGLIAVSHFAGDAAETIMKIGIAIALLAAIVVIFSLLPQDRLEPAVKMLSTIMVAFGVLIAAVAMLTEKSTMFNDTKQIYTSLYNMVAITAVLALIVVGLSMIDATNALPNAVALGVLLISYGASLALIGKAGDINDSVSKILFKMVGITALLAIVLGILSATMKLFSNPESMIASSVALGILLNAFTASILILSNAKHLDNSVIGVLEKMAGVAAVLATFLGLLAIAVSKFGDPNTLIASTVALGILLNAFSASIVVLSLAGDVSATAQAAMIPMILVAGGLAIILGLLTAAMTQHGDINTLIASSIALSILLNAFSVAMLILSYVGPMLLVAVPAVATMALITAGLALVLGRLAVLTTAGGGAEALIPAAAALTILLLGLSATIGVLAVVGVASVLAYPGMLALGVFIAGLTAVVAALGALSLIPGFNELIAGGGTVLSMLGKAIGGFVGGIIEGIAGGVTNMLPALGAALGAFMVNAMPFIAGLKMIGLDDAAKAAILGASILALVGAEVINGVVSLFSLGNITLAQLGSDLSAFMINALPFIAGLNMINPEVASCAGSLAGMILAITASNIINGIASFLGADMSLSTFGTQLAGLGTALKDFAGELEGFDETKVQLVKNAAEAIKAIADAAQNIPNEGGLFGKIFGENGIGAFASQMPSVGENLASFVSKLEGFDKTKVDIVTNASDAIASIAKAAEKIPNEGGLFGKIFGENGIGAFASQMPSVGENLASFVSKLGEFDESKVATIDCASRAIAAMAKSSSSIDGQAEWAKKIFGENGIGAFSGKMPTVGTNLAKFAKNLGTFTDAQVATVNAAVSAIKAFAKLADADLKGAKKQLEGFGDKLTTFATDLSTFCTNLPGSGSMSAAVTTINKLLSMIDDFSGRDPSILTNFSDKLKKIGTDAVDKFVKAFTSDASKTDVKNAGIKLMEKLIDGAESKEKAFTKAIKTIAGAGADAAKEKKDSFKTSGKDLGAGLVNGINAKQQAAYDAGFALGAKAAQGVKDGEDSNSPSKKGIKAGKDLGAGVVIGISGMFKSVYNAGYNMGDTAVQSLSKTISRIGDIISSDVETQPTIRPVLDLSAVSSGVGTLNGMLNTNPTVGLMANVRSISALTESRQNGSIEVVSAINKLGKALNNLPSGDIYSINGITYDDGSNINDAVKTLVRAVRMEGRV